jgi:plasmid stabilization system protein ParE
MMQLKWTSKALSGLVRLYEFLSQKDKLAAARVVQTLTKASKILPSSPRIGERLFEFEPREVRRFLVGHYEMRYEIQESTIFFLSNDFIFKIVKALIPLVSC